MQIIVRFILIIAIISFSGCTHKKVTLVNGWHTIEIVGYEADFPPDFELQEGKGIDSYVGRVKGDSMWFGFDYGYYSSRLIQTPEEYLKGGHWLINVSYQYAKAGEEIPRIRMLSARAAVKEDSLIGAGCDYVANCFFDTIRFLYPVYLPQEIKEHDFEIDTLGAQYRKIVYAKDPFKGVTGIYMADTTVSSINSQLAFSMATGRLNANQQQLALKILKSVRLIQKK